MIDGIQRIPDRLREWILPVHRVRVKEAVGCVKCKGLQGQFSVEARSQEATLEHRGSFLVLIVAQFYGTHRFVGELDAEHAGVVPLKGALQGERAFEERHELLVVASQLEGSGNLLPVVVIPHGIPEDEGDFLHRSVGVGNRHIPHGIPDDPGIPVVGCSPCGTTVIYRMVAAYHIQIFVGFCLRIRRVVRNRYHLLILFCLHLRGGMRRRESGTGGHRHQRHQAGTERAQYISLIHVR